tara:strand:- start:56220 stop:56750 length:531 start_codon:yes stop_codon:yes gene_type:complete
MRYLFMISLLLPAMATADEQRIGFVAGSTYGVGLGYSKQFDDGRGWQVSLLPIIDEDLDSTVFVGGTLFHTLNSTSWGRAYWSLGLAAFYNRQTEEQWSDPECRPDESCPEPVLEGTSLDEGMVVSFGPGVGLERRWKSFAVSLELPLAVQLMVHNKSVGFGGIRPIPNFSLMYFW